MLSWHATDKDVERLLRTTRISIGGHALLDGGVLRAYKFSSCEVQSRCAMVRYRSKFVVIGLFSVRTD